MSNISYEYFVSMELSSITDPSVCKTSQLYILQSSKYIWNFMIFKNDHLLHFSINLHFTAVQSQGSYSLLTGTISKDSVAFST